MAQDRLIQNAHLIPAAVYEANILLAIKVLLQPNCPRVTSECFKLHSFTRFIKLGLNWIFIFFDTKN